MKKNKNDQVDFFSEISDYQITTREFFSATLLDYLAKNFGWNKVLILYFDTEGNFLSCTNWQGALLSHKNHPYKKFAEEDLVKNKIFQDALSERLTYFDVTPRVYKASSIIGEQDYEKSIYVQFIEKNFNQRYSATMAFGINAYIQLVFFKSSDQGDFTKEEMRELKNIYIYLANSYKNFKKYEQSKIVQKIQNEIITSGEKAYLITDNFMHIMNYSNSAMDYLSDILGASIAQQINTETPCSWLPFLLGDETIICSKMVRTKIIQNYIFKIYTYDQTYSNGIIDRYHWITITEKKNAKNNKPLLKDLPLTNTEHKVANLLYQGLTYKDIADKMVISYHTVKKHVQNIYNKCNVNSRYELSKLFEKEK